MPKIENLTSSEFEKLNPEAKVLLFDIETAPNISMIWGHYEQNALTHVQERYMLAFCAKWLDGKTISKCLPDYEGYEPHKDNDLALVKDLWKLFDEADIIVGHNLNSFDIKMASARFIIHGLPPPSPYKTVDTKLVARRYFRFNSNKLDDLGKTLGVGRKVVHTGFQLWLDCLAGDEKAWRLMRKYNRQDVMLLERVYLKLRPHITNHPNIAILKEVEDGCPNCGSSQLQRRGWTPPTSLGRRRQYHCQGCGAWHKGQYQRITKVGAQV